MFKVYPKQLLTYYLQEQFRYYHLVFLGLLALSGAYSITYLMGQNQVKNSLNPPSGQVAKVVTNRPSSIKVARPVVKINKQKAVKSVWNLPQVQRKAKEIKTLSQGTIDVGVVVSSYPKTSQPFYTVKVLENHPDSTTSPVYWFRVSSSNGAIQPLDLVSNKYTTLTNWNPDGI
ncbi:hypothetical protein GSN00_04330 [Cylindrospermopsis raciborskii CHAB3438]|uniref:hypothetical protein n=1 Tax=Cylindrospermopsis raciborskii TaxID=77022 RepID=UPI001F0E6BD7|nr:hypothetical protein [Cylindrospermopsis raciborskii]MCH4903623.1 hypothetical protein [Cylindrospermopsis raciborskii CHAB3438]MEB3146171.1 hypothetical protein [Cylindrospermopsis raciborskii]